MQPERPLSWYHTSKEFTGTEEAYCKFLEETFMVKDPLGNAIPYVMTDYQREWHSESINVKQESAKDVLVIKARGISFTYSTMIDFIMTAAVMQGQVLPIIAQRFGASKDIVHVAGWLCKNCKLADIRDNVEVMETEIKFLKTGSVIRAYPSATAADSVRSLRLIRAFIDEIAFQQRGKELMAAVQECMRSKYGQMVIGSTPNGRQNLFFEMVQNPSGYKFFRLPVFDEKKFIRGRSLLEQDLTPIAPWIDKAKLEVKRMRDEEIFMQENMCSFIDDSLSFFPYGLVKRCENQDLLNFMDVLKENPFALYQTENPIIAGVDVATTTHLTAVSIFEVMPDENEPSKKTLVQRALYTIKNMEIPKQVEVLKKLIECFPTMVKMRIDATGLGVGLVQYLKKAYPAKVEGITFSGTIRTGDSMKGGQGKAKIREYMLVNMKAMMESGLVQFLEDDLQLRHMTSMNYAFEVADGKDGHGDIIFSNALALMPLDYSSVPTNPLITSQSLKASNAVDLSKNPNEWTIEQKLDWLKNQQRRRI